MFNRLTRKALRWFTKYRQTHPGRTLYELKADLEDTLEISRTILQATIPLISFILFGYLLFDGGFNRFYYVDHVLYRFWFYTLSLMEIALILYFVLSLPLRLPMRARVVNVLIIVLTFFLIVACNDFYTGESFPGDGNFLLLKLFLYSGTTLLFVTEASYVFRFIYVKGVNPAFLFVGSFFALIIIGSLLLMLPNSTNSPITFVDAWFTSASAICVTGLTVVDTATTFTLTGKIILLALIQTGGLGIMTFAGLLSYLSSGTVSYRNQLALRDMMSSNKISTVIALITRVIAVTLFFEAGGAVAVYNSVPANIFNNTFERIFFSVFHSVSAFCNAGFSTYSNGLFELPVRFNYSLHLVLAMLILLGGLGFPIVFKIFSYFRIRILKPVYSLMGIELRETHIHVLDTTSRVALSTTAVLLVFGFLTFYFFEADASLKQHDTETGKVVTALFSAITPRTAGFNTVDMMHLTMPTIMIYLLLMWIGASPGSTGGGIKTTVIATAFLNLRAIALGRERTEVHHTQIGEQTISRAFAIILLSLLVIGVTVLLLSLNEPEKPLFALAFEAFSAFSTVGLTIGVTPELGITSKFLLTFVMLIGRVGVLTMLFAFIPPVKPRYFRYPREEISL